jgi:peroxiredoxin
MRSLLTTALLLALLLAAGCGSDDPAAPADDGGTPPPTTTTGTDVGDEAPDFTLQDAAGGNVTLSELRGQPVLLYFWASWCTYCAIQSPRVEDFHQTYGGDLGVYTVNISDSIPVIDAYVAQHGYTFPVLISTSGMVSSYGVSGIPQALVLDAAGVVLFNGHPAGLTDEFLAGL